MKKEHIEAFEANFKNIQYKLKNDYVFVSTIKAKYQVGNFVLSSDARPKINEAIVLTDSDEYKAGDVVLLSEHAITGVDLLTIFKDMDPDLTTLVKEIGIIMVADILGVKK